MSTLRARRRQRTTDTIRKAAIGLAHEHGVDAVTVEMISAKAGVSPRTFFNYFPFRESALTPPDLDFTEAQIAQFVAGRGTLLDDFLLLISPILESLGDDRETWRKCHELEATAPKLLALNYSIFVKFDKAITAALCQRLNTPPCDPTTLHLAALIAATIRCGLGIWVVAGQGSAESNLRDRLRALPEVAAAVAQ